MLEVSEMRIGGLASGMDIDQIVSDLMKAERIKVDKLEQDKQILEWKQEIYNDLNKDLANFILDTKKDLGLNSTSSTGVLLNRSVSSLTWVKSASTADTTIADVTARADAAQGTYNLTVDQLAENWSAASSTGISSGDISNLADQFGLADSDTINFTITTNEGSVTINKTNLQDVDLDEIIDEINNANIGVSAIYDSEIDRFFLQTTKTGSENTIQITDSSTLSNGDTSFITGNTSTLKLQYLDATDTSQDITDGNVYAGQDAQVDFGAAVDIVKSSNQFTINGIEFNLKSQGTTTITVDTDVDAVYEKINNFVEKYNEIVDKINEKLGEKRYRDYLPLTEEQKKEMSEEDIELWEEKAKSGLIKNEMILQRTMQNMRSGMYAAVEGITGSYDQLTEIGIATQSYESGSLGGKLVIDETELKEAILEDVDGVLDLLFKEPSSDLNVSDDSLTASQIEQKRSESGLITRLYDNMIVGMKDIINKSGVGDNAALYRDVNSAILLDFVTEYGSISMLGKNVNELDDRIIDMNDHLLEVEDRYWRQFTAMEKAIQKMNQQSMWLAQQFGGGQ